MIIFLQLFFFILSVLVRLIPIWHKRFQGCDAYYFLLYREYIIKQKKIFPTFPNYFLLEDSKQTYPPGFALFLLLFPERILQKYYWLISPVLDSLILSAGLTLTYFYTESLILIVLIAIAYIFSFASIRETASMTSRQLGVLLITLTILPFFLFIIDKNIYYLILSLFTAFLLLLTHKLSFQSLWFVFPVISIIENDYRFVLFLIAIIVSTYLFSIGAYKRIIYGHFDILRFWYRNNTKLHVHQIYESLIYKKKSWKEKKKRYPKNYFRLIFIYGRRFFIFNSFILLVFTIPFIPNLQYFDYLLFLWAITTYCFAFLTILVPKLRFLGEGEKYLKLVTFPVIYLSTLPYSYNFLEADLFFIVWFTLLSIEIAEFIYETYKSRKNKNISSSRATLENIFKEIKTKNIKKLICIPGAHSESISYHCRISTLQGGHNVPMVKLLEDFFPIIKKPLSFFQGKYQVNYLLLDTNYCVAKDLRISRKNKIFQDKQFEIYKLG